MRRKTAFHSVLLLGGAFAATACARQASPGRPPGEPASPTGAEALAVAAAATAAAAERAAVAAEAARHPRVRSYAHAAQEAYGVAAERLAEAHLRRGGGEPPAAREVRARGAETAEALRGASLLAVDRRYVIEEARWLEWFAQAADEALIPAAGDPEVRTVLVSLRDGMEAWREEVEELQRRLLGFVR